MKPKKLVPLPTLLKRAQTVFNSFIRSRDKDKGCICFGCNGPVEHASHYHSQGHFSSLRFDPLNVAGSCARCNLFLSGNLIQMRRGLVARHGEEKIKWLEDYATKHRVKKWQRFELEAIIQEYKLKTA